MHGSLPETLDISVADLAACRETLRGGSRSFHAASLVLPRRVRKPAVALYAFCRLADDAIDAEGAAPDALRMLQDRLDRIYAGKPAPIAADRALAAVVARFAVPQAILNALLEGLAWDAAGRRYGDLSDLTAYAARVAGTVGAMMALLMGRRDPRIIATACDLGIAMQLTNIARDVGEDARAGRLYVPLRWMREAGIDVETWLSQPVFTPRLGTVVARLLQAADGFYRRAEAGIDTLPLDCRPGIRAARLLYADIGRVVEDNGFDSVSRRAFVPGRRKATLLLRAVFDTMAPHSHTAPAPIAETRFLVEAVMQLPARAHAKADPPKRATELIALFERLERRERLERLDIAKRA